MMRWSGQEARSITAQGVLRGHLGGEWVMVMVLVLGLEVSALPLRVGDESAVPFVVGDGDGSEDAVPVKAFTSASIRCSAIKNTTV